MFKNITIASLLLPFLLFISTSFAFASPFGAAGKFNVYSMGSIDIIRSNFQGIAGAGGNIVAEDFQVGDGIGSSQDYTLYAGGNINATYGSNFNGGIEAEGYIDVNNIYVEGSINTGTDFIGFDGTVMGNINAANSTSVTNMFVAGDVTNNPFSATIDHLEIANQLINTSADYSALTANSFYTSDFGGDILTFTGVSGLNIFDITAAEFLNSWGTIKFVGSENASFLLNVSGSDVNIVGKGFDLEGVALDMIVFNAFEATDLYMENIGLPGTMLAPYADTYFDTARIDGRLYVANLYGSDTLVAAPVPEPATIFLMGLGLAILFIRQVKRKNSDNLE